MLFLLRRTPVTSIIAARLAASARARGYYQTPPAAANLGIRDTILISAVLSCKVRRLVRRSVGVGGSLGEGGLNVGGLLRLRR